MSNGDSPRILGTENPGEELQVMVEPAEGNLLLYHGGGSALLVDAFLETAILGPRTRKLCSWIGEVPDEPRELKSLARAFEPSSPVLPLPAAPCRTSIEIFAAERRGTENKGKETSLVFSLPSREEGTTSRSIFLRPQGFDLRIVIRATLPNGEATGRPGCERWLVSGEWHCAEQAPATHELLSPAGRRVQFRFQDLEGSRPGSGKPFEPFELGGIELDSDAGFITASINIRPESEVSKPWLVVEGKGGAATLKVATLRVEGDRLKAKVGGSGTIRGHRAAGESLLNLLQAYPTLSLLLAALHSAILAWMWRRWAVARGKN